MPHHVNDSAQSSDQRYIASGGILAHDSVVDPLHGEKSLIGVSIIALFSINYFDGILGMTARYREIREIG